MVTEILLEELIRCPKQVLKAERRKMLLENRHYKNSISLASIDEKYKFTMFMRISDEFIEDFSVGLIWENANEHIEINKKIILLRCQGPHDSGKPLGEDMHHSYHIHEATVQDIIERRYLKPSNKDVTKSFNSFSSAVKYFSENCGIIKLGDHIDLDDLPDNFIQQTTLY